MTPDEQQTFDTLTVERDNARESADLFKKQRDDRVRYASESQTTMFRMAARINTYRLLLSILAVFIVGSLVNVIGQHYNAWYIAAYTCATTAAVIALVNLILDNNYDK